MQRMIKALFSLLLLVFCKNAFTANSTCDNIPGKQSYSPLKVNNGLVCFIEKSVVDERSKEKYEQQYINLYYVASGSEAVKVEDEGFLYDYNAGKIIDAFLLDVDHDGKNEIIVIHNFEIRHTLAEPNSSGIYYGVYVFDQTETGLKRNLRASAWFGFTYSAFYQNQKVIYKYPFTNQYSVRQAILSPFAVLIMRDEIISVIVKRKTYLYDASTADNLTKKYLIAGDKGTVDKHENGLCRINYIGGKKPLQMWIMCDVLELGRVHTN
jgi:hypothetical protein